MYALVLIVAVWLLSAFRAKAWLWSLVLGGWLLTATLAYSFRWWILILWGCYGLLVLLLHHPCTRRRRITAPIYNQMRNMVSKVSTEELADLEDVTAGWDTELFSGTPDWKRWLAHDPPRLSSREQEFMDGPVKELCAMLDDWDITENLRDLPQEVWDCIKQKGFMGMQIPKEYGGMQFSPLAQSEVIMRLATRSITAAVTVMVPNSIGPAELLVKYGTHEQQKRWLPALSCGNEIPCFVLTGVQSGSDAISQTPDIGIVCEQEYEGKKTLGLKLNWEKRYITLAPVATLLGLVFRVYDPERLLGEDTDYGMTFALVPTHLKGVHIGRRHNPMDVPFMNGPTEGKDVFIPLDHVIGERDGIGHGRNMLIECLSVGRSISLPALSTAGGQLASYAVGAYASVRRQFHLSIGRFGGVEEPLARIAGYTYIMNATRKITCDALNRGEKSAVIAAMAKSNFTECMRRVANDAMDVTGGKGLMLGPRNWLGQLYKATPIGITVEGANILTRTLMIFGLGALRCHPYLGKEFNALANKDVPEGITQFDILLQEHFAYTISSFSRSLFHGLTGARFVRVPTGKLRRHFQNITRLSAVYALVADIAILGLGSKLRRKEKLSGRMADALSWLYLMSCVLKEFHDSGTPEEERPLVDWACATGCHVVEESLLETLRNLRPAPLGCFLRLICFPLGRKHPVPTDSQSHLVARTILEPSTVRSRLTEGVFVAETEDDQLTLLNEALMLAVKTEGLERTVRTAIREGTVRYGFEKDLLAQLRDNGVLSETEADLLEKAWSVRRRVIEVDDFPANYWSRRQL